MKRLRKQEQWEAKKELVKAKRKEKRQKSKTCHAHLIRFNQIAKEGEERGKLSKQEKQGMFKELCQKGPKYVIDCEFDDLMQDRELKSLGQQLAYCHSINKRLEKPLNIFLTGVGPRLKTIMTQ